MIPVILMRSPKRELILARQNFYMEQVKVRVLGNFHNMEEEAAQFGDQSEDDDSKYWDATEFYMLLRYVKTQTTLGALASLYHQWEKEFRDFMKDELSRSYGRAKITNCVWKPEINEIFSKLEEFGWSIRQAQWFSLLNACRLIVNVYKHGKGRSFKELGRDYPQYLKGWDADMDDYDEALEITEEEYDEIAGALRQFWMDFPERLTRV